MTKQEPMTDIEETILVRKLNLFEKNNSQLSCILADIASVTTRLRHIGYSLDQNSHPDNKPSEIESSHNKNGKEASGSSGLVGQFEFLLQQQNHIIDKWNHGVFEELCRQIAFLEKHI